MRHTAAEKYEVIRLVEGSELPVRRTLRELQVNRSTFYAWYRRYTERGRAGLHPKPSTARRYWNRIPPRVRQRVVEAALADPERSPRELAWQLTDREGHFLSESSVYRISEGVRPDSESGLHRTRGGEEVSASHPSAERTLADGFHVPAGRRLGLVLPVDRTGRLLPLHRGLDVADIDAGV